MHKLVSIITPCYNGEKYLDRYFNSLLAQTYPAIEVVFINDGSKDRTEEMALAYGEKLKAKGYQFIYYYQENAGQSAAINQGLKVFKGDYLNWTDADNYLPADSVEKRVARFEKDPDLGLVFGRTAIFDNSDNIIGLIKEDGVFKPTPHRLVEDLLKGSSCCTCCCSTMVRSSMFRESMPVPLQIETPREIGQNFQLFIPIMLSYKAVFVPEVFGYYIFHKDSHSQSKKTFEQRMDILDVAYNTLTSISDRLKVDEGQRRWFSKIIAEYDGKNRLLSMLLYRRADGLKDTVRKLKQSGAYDLSARKIVLKIKYPFIKRLADRVWKKNNNR